MEKRRKESGRAGKGQVEKETRKRKGKDGNGGESRKDLGGKRISQMERREKEETWREDEPGEQGKLRWTEKKGRGGEKKS